MTYMQRSEDNFRCWSYLLLWLTTGTLLVFSAIRLAGPGASMGTFWTGGKRRPFPSKRYCYGNVESL